MSRPARSDRERLPLDEVERFDSGALQSGTLTADCDVDGLPCRGGRDLVFDESGALRWACLGRPHTVGGVPCAPGPIYLHESGALANAALAAAWAGREPGTRVTLADDGALLEWSREVPEDGMVEGLPCRRDFRVWCHADGTLSHVVLARDAVVAGVHYPRHTEIELDQTGAVLAAQTLTLADGQEYKRKNYGRLRP